MGSRKKKSRFSRITKGLACLAVACALFGAACVIHAAMPPATRTPSAHPLTDDTPPDAKFLRKLPLITAALAFLSLTAGLAFLLIPNPTGPDRNRRRNPRATYRTDVWVDDPNDPFTY
jgi:hypothetical protein